MEAALLYWLKANVVLALFVAAYYALLRRLTFFGLNRAYLLFALAFAAAYPLLPMPALLPATASSLPLAASAGHLPLGATGPPSQPLGYGPYLWLGGLVLYLAGAAVLLLRLLGQLLSLALVRRRSRPAVALGQAVRVVPGAGGPFSFGSTIYLTESALLDAAGLPATLRHEQAHVRQHHTLDVLLLQVATALAWANPAAWLLRRFALDNLEYLADRATLQPGDLPRRDYQYLLLRQQAGGVPAPALAFHFSFFTLKNRIHMLNQPLSSSRQLGRYLLAAPVVVLLALGYSGARAQSATPTYTVRPTGSNALSQTTVSVKSSYPPVYYVDAQPSTADAVHALAPDNIASLDVVKDKAIVQQYTKDPAATGIVFITTKANATSPAVLALAEKLDLSSGYKYTPVEVYVVVPKALAYITSHYPDARLGGQVTELKKKSTGAVKYQVQLIRSKRPFYVYFSPEGDFLGE